MRFFLNFIRKSIFLNDILLYYTSEVNLYKGRFLFFQFHLQFFFYFAVLFGYFHFGNRLRKQKYPQTLKTSVKKIEKAKRCLCGDRPQLSNAKINT